MYTSKITPPPLHAALLVTLCVFKSLLPAIPLYSDWSAFTGLRRNRAPYFHLSSAGVAAPRAVLGAVIVESWQLQQLICFSCENHDHWSVLAKKKVVSCEVVCGSVRLHTSKGFSDLSKLGWVAGQKTENDILAESPHQCFSALSGLWPDCWVTHFSCTLSCHTDLVNLNVTFINPMIVIQ